MQPPETARMPDPALVEKVVMALDGGCPATAEALATELGVPAASLGGILDLVHRYRDCIAAERAPLPRTDAWPEDGLPPGTRLGDFVLDHVLGSGAMGVVYAARQVSLGHRHVALKVLPRLLVSRDPRFVQRFRREAALAATIHHPNMAEVYGFDEAGDTLCFAMRLVEGPTLHTVLADVAADNQGPVRRTSPQHVQACVKLVRGLADALAAIHERGLVHRDVKPSNVMLEGVPGRGPAQLSARPVLVDFGLLRPAGDTDLTGTKTMLGTPAYASYEAQVGRELDARADVFSLGAVFHDLLTSTPPGTRGPATAGLPNVRAVNPTVDARLAAIVAMALQEKKELRYEHGGALRDELDRYQRGEPLRALPTGWFGRLRLWARRDPVRAMRIGLAAAVPAALVAIVFVWFLSTALSLHAAASLGANHERDGDLLAAATAYRELYRAGGQARVLPGLTSAIARAELYCARDGALQPALESLAAGTTRLEDDPDNPHAAELDFAVAHHRLCERLLGEPPVATDAIQAFLLRETIQGSPQFRQRLAMDSWANFLIAQEGRQVLPPGLAEALWSLIGPTAPAGLEASTRHAAVVAYGSIRTFEAFSRLIDLMADQDIEVGKSAATCSWYLYSWLHKELPEEYAKISSGTMRRWALAADAIGQRIGTGLFWSIACHLAWWERPLLPTSVARAPLDLPTPLRAQVDAQIGHLAEEWARAGQRLDRATEPFRVVAGDRAELFDGAIWKFDPDRDRLRLLAGPAPRNAELGRGKLRFEYDANGAPRTVIDGTVHEVAARGGIVTPWEERARSPYLLFARPGHSLLRIRSAVPARAGRLTIRVVHMKGVRPILRNGGEVMLRYSLSGLPWVQSTSGPGSPRRGDRPMGDDDTTTVFDVKGHVFDAAQDVEFVVEYQHGNTSHRILEVGFEWEIR